MPLTQAKFRENDYEGCPNCGSFLSAEFIEDDPCAWPHQHRSRYQCNECGATWSVVYKPIGYGELEMNGKPIPDAEEVPDATPQS